MNYFPQETLAGMSVEDLRVHIQELCFEKKEQAARLAELNSAIGQEAVRRLTHRLQRTRERYARIGISGKTDRDIVMAFVENRAAERFIAEELEALNSAKEVADALDKYHALCDNALKTREKAEKRSR